MPLYSFAMQADFVEEPKTWYGNDNNFVNHPQQSIGTYTGIYSYYSDIENNCFYLRISYTEASVNTLTNDVYVNFNIENSSRKYQFYVDNNGFFNADSSVKSAFDVAVNFGNPTEQGQEIYIGLEFRNKNDKKCNNVISFSLSINGQSYDICNGIELNYQAEETSGVSNKESTSRASVATTQPETKFKYTGDINTTQSEKYSYSYKSTEKFVYEQTQGSDNNQSDYDEAETQSNDAEIKVKPKKEFAPSSKIMLAASGLCVMIGTSLIACAIVIRKRISRKEQENE